MAVRHRSHWAISFALVSMTVFAPVRRSNMSSLEQSKDRYQGIFIAAPVPMKDDFSLDLPKIQNCVQYLIDAGMGVGNAVYTVMGAGGEHMHLTIEERKAVAKASVQFAAGRLPVFV